ncbi:MAG: hypothetical protein E7J99_03725 [Clostridium butyricum]|uniref:hypothetical protein n=1 Tax=Clostridium sp. TaxID=1506 RepID=UPI0029006276|nr:hypothetical protein [Clostridium sp.]MDU1115303.1 hypothetical protein [Clostridium sp.]MDU7711239.1 hypothetical protein [Clostridium butyricum]
MSKIKFLRVNNFLGIDEREVEAAKINIFKGPNGKGKTSVIEAIEKTFTNKNRRSEVIKHGEDESTLFVELDDGLSIDRRIREGKANYLKVRQDGKGADSTEKFVNSLVNGNIFRPLDWVNLSVKEQTESLLSMLQIGWSEEDIINWFGELPDNIEYNKHILLILKDIEQKYYKVREEVNREIKELKARIKSIVDDLPAEYDGEKWKSVDIKEYYARVTEAQNVNKLISQAKSLKDNFNDKVESIKSNGEAEKSRITLKYKLEREDIQDIISLANGKIEKANNFIANADHELELKIKELTNDNTSKINEADSDYQSSLKDLEKEFQERKETLKKVHESHIDTLKNGLITSIESSKKQSVSQLEEQKDLISINQNKISAKNQELIGLDDKEKLESEAVDSKIESEIEKVKATIGNAAKYLEEHEEVDIEPLQAEADEAQKMISYLRDWDRISEIRDNQLAPKEEYADNLTSKISKARSLPAELLQTANMPIEGISVDEYSRVRINETLIDGLSDGEKLELAMKVAKAQCGELKVICMDKWESLDKAAQDKLLESMSEDDYQYFVTEVAQTESNDVEVEKIG